MFRGRSSRRSTLQWNHHETPAKQTPIHTWRVRREGVGERERRKQKKNKRKRRERQQPAFQRTSQLARLFSPRRSHEAWVYNTVCLEEAREGDWVKLKQRTSCCLFLLRFAERGKSLEGVGEVQTEGPFSSREARTRMMKTQRIDPGYLWQLSPFLAPTQRALLHSDAHTHRKRRYVLLLPRTDTQSSAYKETVHNNKKKGVREGGGGGKEERPQCRGARSSS